MSGEAFRDKGVIKKIYLKDFITYNEVTVTPGRNLNMIIGPNGTGKSTLVSALALGFGATPKTLGKSCPIGDYVRRGCERATIVIHVQHSPHRILQLTRIITTENKSTWIIDGKPVTESKVREVINDLNIQVNNLCQFLPQERVQDFAGLDARQLLISTEKSVGDPRLHGFHTQLIEFRGKEGQMIAEIEQKKSKLDIDKQTFARLEESVSTIKERTTMINKLKKLNQKKAWMEYNDAKKVTTETKAQKDQLSLELIQLQESLAPSDALIKKKKNEIRNLENLVNSHNRKITEHEIKLNTTVEKFENCHCDINNIKKESTMEIELEKSRDQEIKKAEILKNKLENDKPLLIQELGSVEVITKRFQECDYLLENQKRVTEDLSDKTSRLRNECDKMKYEISNFQRLIKNLKNVEDKCMDILRQCSSDTFEGVQWLRRNTDKFQGKIFEPMILTLQVDHPDHAKYVERVIPQRDLIAFVCESKDDMNSLLTYLREERKLVINAVHSDPNKNYNNRPHIPLDQLRQLGFQNYLIDFIDAPPTVMNYLVSMYNIHNIPVGTAAVENQADHVPDSISLYFSPNNSYSVRRSKYTGDKSTSISQLSGTRYFNVNIDTRKIQALEQKVVDYQRHLDDYNQQMETVVGQHQEECRKLEEIRNNKAKLRSDLSQIQKLEADINVAKIKLQKLQIDRKSIESIKGNAQQRILRAIKKQIGYYTECNQLYEKVVLMSSQAKTDSFKLKLMQQELIKFSEESQTLRENVERVRENVRKLEKELDGMMKALREYKKKAVEETDNIDSDDPRFKRIQAAFNKLPGTFTEIEEAMQAAKAKLYCLDRTENGEQILAEYDKLSHDIEKLEGEIKALEEKRQESKEQISKLHDEWIPLISGLVEKIGTNFSEYFESVGCVGEIKLHVPENPKDYDQYEMQISVKFRDADELQIFDRQRQSGGEKAFTTAVYMLALQEMCNVPFRCVDEINQGMDPIYERRVMDLLVELTTNRSGSQYFLITPKLLPHLHYNDNCRIHVVHNGPWVQPTDKFNVQHFYSRISV
ncbi:structural maintenance of chromosomes protein 5 [Cotesia glomerata]|uniref:structural maintenance of chromosomes protein 5 n=1 Tax=Cotesia glomerata TaxID=32391 RepID=UPI001D024B0B|nr:structural maintenance of chromosomes protein 5 [Cotesia glomerata]